MALGHNQELLGGFYVTSDYFTISVRPQIVHQENHDFPEPRFIPRYPDGEIRYVAEGNRPRGYTGRTDRPPFPVRAGFVHNGRLGTLLGPHPL
jgi:hypothetical protein